MKGNAYMKYVLILDYINGSSQLLRYNKYIYIYIYTSTLLNYNNESVIVLKKVDIDLLPALKGHNTFDFSCLVLKRMDTNLT